MRLLHVVPTYIPAYSYGGPIRSVHGLCKGLAGLGHDVHVFTTNIDQTKDSDVPLQSPVYIDGVSVWYFPSKHLRRLFWSPPMKKALDERVKGFDLLHAHSIFLWPTWAATRSARHAHVPYIIAPRGMLVRKLVLKKSRCAKTVWIHFVERKNLENASAIHMTSETEANEAVRFGFRLPRVVIVPNGIDYSEEFFIEDIVSGHIRSMIGRPFLLFLGRINWKKGLDRLVQALSFVNDIPLVIAGNDEENYQPELERLAKKIGVLNRIIFVGPVHGQDKAALLRRAAALILPSYSENFGIVVIEAMAAGCPVVVTPEVGLADTVRETGAGIVTDGTPEIMGKGIKNLLSDHGLMKQMGINGRKAVKECFTWDSVAGQMERVYETILEYRRTGHND